MVYAVSGRILQDRSGVEARSERDRPVVVSVEREADDGGVLRLVARSELVALVRDGLVEAAMPTIIVALDVTTRAVLEVDQVAVGKDLLLLALPAPSWWLEQPARRRQAEASRWGLADLEESG